MGLVDRQVLPVPANLSILVRLAALRDRAYPLRLERLQALGDLLRPEAPTVRLDPVIRGSPAVRLVPPSLEVQPDPWAPRDLPVPAVPAGPQARTYPPRLGDLEALEAPMDLLHPGVLVLRWVLVGPGFPEVLLAPATLVDRRVPWLPA